MEHLDVDREENLARVAIKRPPANALEGTLIEELRRIFDEMDEDEAIEGIVLDSNVEGFFSAGLDLFELAEYDDTELETFVENVLKLTLEMLDHTLPIVAAVRGHCMAAGAHLAAYADFRVAAEGDYKLSFHEVEVGVPVTEPEILPVKDLVGSRIRELFLQGAVWGPQEALEAGLLDEVVPAPQLTNAAIALAKDLADKPTKNYALIRRSVRGRAVELFENRMDDYVGQIMEVMTDPEARAAIADRIDFISP